MFNYNKLNETHINDFSDDELSFDNYCELPSLEDTMTSTASRISTSTIDVVNALLVEIGFRNLAELNISGTVIQAQYEGIGLRNTLFIKNPNFSNIDEFLMHNGWTIYSKYDIDQIIAGKLTTAPDKEFINSYKAMINDATDLLYKSIDDKITKESLRGVALSANRGFICLTYKTIVIFFGTGEVNYYENDNYHYVEAPEAAVLNKLLLKSIKGSCKKLANGLIKDLYFEPVGHGENKEIAEYRYTYYMSHNNDISEQLQNYMYMFTMNSQSGSTVTSYNYDTIHEATFKSEFVNKLVDKFPKLATAYEYSDGKNRYLFIIEYDNSVINHVGYLSTTRCTAHLILNP